MERKHRIVIGVMGPSQCDEEISGLAYQVGRLIAERGAVLLCGGRSGVMEAAARGAKEAGGLTIGIMPGLNAEESPPNDFIEVAIFTGLREARNWVNVCSSDALIAIGGGYGTLSEIALALKIGKPVVLLRSWRFESDQALPPVPQAQTAQEAIDMVFQGF
jgi:uncharacterized protein (TIGR00725 family)